MLGHTFIGRSRMDASEIDPIFEELIRELRIALNPRRLKPQKAPSPPKPQAAPHTPEPPTAKQIAKEAKRKARKEERERKAKLLIQQAEIERKKKLRLACVECHAELPPPEVDDFLPRLCRRCESRNAALSAGFQPKSATQYSSVKIVQGGSPGLGRRK